MSNVPSSFTEGSARLAAYGWKIWTFFRVTVMGAVGDAAGAGVATAAVLDGFALGGGGANDAAWALATVDAAGGVSLAAGSDLPQPEATSSTIVPTPHKAPFRTRSPPRG